MEVLKSGTWYLKKQAVSISIVFQEIDDTSIDRDTSESQAAFDATDYITDQYTGSDIEIWLRIPQRSKHRLEDLLIDDNVYLHENEFNYGQANNANYFSEATSSAKSNLWVAAVQEELKSMRDNIFWEYIDLPDNFTPICCKEVYKVKRDFRGNIERFTAR